MADTLLRFKPIITEDVYKGIDKTYSVARQAYGGPNWDGIASEKITWHYVERTNEGNAWSSLTDDLKNLFHSFGISREDDDDWFKVFNVNDWWNAKRMIIATIPQSGCGSYIDGSTVRINVPIGTGATEYVALYGSNFNGYPDPVNGTQLAPEYADSVFGGAFCYLFGTTNGTLAQGNLPAVAFGTYGTDHPYTGTVDGGTNPNTGIKDWDPDEAVVGTTWTTAAATKSPHYAATHWTHGDTARDVPYGIALLEKGIFIIFDAYGRDDLVGSTGSSATTLWNASHTLFSAVTSAGTLNSSTANRKFISFEGVNASANTSIFYRTVTQAYKMVYFCHAGQNEFNSTSNHTYNQKKAYFRPEEADSLWITEIGLYDDTDTLLAYAKLSQPVEKNKLETMTFKVELEL